MKIDQQGTAAMIAVHVDDLLIAARTKELIRHTVTDLQQHFQVKELGLVQWLLGIAIQRDRETCTTLMHRHKYITDMVERFGQQDAMPINLPYAGGEERQPDQATPCTTKEISRYRSIVCSLLYAVVATRLDITETVE